jgi:hypothetical protein
MSSLREGVRRGRREGRKEVHAARHVVPACTIGHEVPACAVRHGMPACTIRHVMSVYCAIFFSSFFHPCFVPFVLLTVLHTFALLANLSRVSKFSLLN